MLLELDRPLVLTIARIRANPVKPTWGLRLAAGGERDVGGGALARARSGGGYVGVLQGDAGK